MVKFDYKAHLNKDEKMISLYGYDLFCEKSKCYELGFSFRWIKDSYSYFRHTISLSINLFFIKIVFNFMFWRN